MSLLSIMSWNMHQQHSNWATVLNSGVDVALLQEAKPPPLNLRKKISSDFEGIWGDSETFWCAAVAGLSNRIEFIPIGTQPLESFEEDLLRVSYPGTISAAEVVIKETNEKFILISLYARWERPIMKKRPLFADASAHRLISDLSAFLGWIRNNRVIVAGDLNILYGYGEYDNNYWKKRYDTVFDRMDTLGLRFVGPQAPNGKQATPWPEELPKDSLNVPTYRTRKNKPETATRQLDFVFASEDIAPRLTVSAANSEAEWGASDHCRVFIDLNY